MEHTKTIGFFDSGIGGLTVLSEALCRIPGADILFYADTDHVPYGTKTREQIVRYAEDAVSSLCERGAEAVVVACNTATSMAISTLRERFPIPIIGMEPAVKPAAAIHPDEKILVCATPVTIRGEKLHMLIDRSFHEGIRPTLAALPGLVELAETERFDLPSVREYLDTVIDRRVPYAAVVLGCTPRFLPGAFSGGGYPRRKHRDGQPPGRSDRRRDPRRRADHLPRIRTSRYGAGQARALRTLPRSDADALIARAFFHPVFTFPTQKHGKTVNFPRYNQA